MSLVGELVSVQDELDRLRSGLRSWLDEPGEHP
jgi:hypothetical protein